MTCQELADYLMQYIDGELPEAQRASLASHLDLCPPCLAYLHSYRQAVELGQKLCADSAGPIPDDVPEELVQAILTARAQKA